uniref:Uncharacterized protein n=1 Tax=Rhizophora mucronata TaxID=61149 RepID=A0A2P2NEI9_RHIMU
MDTLSKTTKMPLIMKHTIT